MKIKKLTKLNLFLTKIKDISYLNLIEHKNNFYINYCCENITKKLSIRNPTFIIIDTNNKYDVLKVIYLSNVEHLTNLKSYDIHLNKNKKNKTIIYDKIHSYNLYAIISDTIEVYKLDEEESEEIIEEPLYKTSNNISSDTELKKYIKKINNVIQELKENDLKKIAKCLMENLIYIKDFFNKKTLLKPDYIKLIKKLYPYYINLHKYKLDKLKNIYHSKCSTNINLQYNNFSCYIDSLIVSLFNSKNPIIEEVILNSPLNYDENKNDAKLIKYAEEIREELKSLYMNLTTKKNNTCTTLRKLFKKYYDRYKLKINRKFHHVEWTFSQNDFSETIILLGIIFKFPLILKYSMNSNIEYRDFFDVNNNFVYNNEDIAYIKKYYPKHKNIVELENNKIREEKIEYIGAPFLLIQINRIINEEKISFKIIPELKLKLKDNDLYLNSIIIHQGSKDYNSGHYICLYECKGIWYEFNDMRGYAIEIGKFDKILKNNNYIENITGLLYISL